MRTGQQSRAIESRLCILRTGSCCTSFQPIDTTDGTFVYLSVQSGATTTAGEGFIPNLKLKRSDRVKRGDKFFSGTLIHANLHSSKTGASRPSSKLSGN